MTPLFFYNFIQGSCGGNDFRSPLGEEDGLSAGAVINYFDRLTDGKCAKSQN